MSGFQKRREMNMVQKAQRIRPDLWKLASIVGASWVLALPALAATRPAASLPDWAGSWENAGSPDNLDLFDGQTADPPGCRATTQPCRSHPPLTEAWELKYRSQLDKTAGGRLQPPSASCMPRGPPADMRTTNDIEFVLRPEEVWIFIENTPLPRRVFTDGRAWPEDIEPLASTTPAAPFGARCHRMCCSQP
jgi:hypothetical protein